MKNRIKQLRMALGLSQRELAERIGTSQQQIQRIEAGRIAARLEIAIRLSQALGKPLNTVFPDSVRALKKMTGNTKASGFLPSDDEYSKLNETGIEGDSANWSINILLRGHKKRMNFKIPPEEQRRLFRAVQSETEHERFVVFDTSDSRVAVNLREVDYCHFLFDHGEDRGKNPAEGLEVRVFFSGSPEPHSFGAEPDEGDPDDEDDPGQLRNIFFAFETTVEDHERLSFTDEDGERVFLRGGNIALFEVALELVEPTPLDDEEESSQPSTAGKK